MAVEDEKPGIKEDVWAHTAGGMCYSDCAVIAHGVDGTAITLEGDPWTAQEYGRICAKEWPGSRISMIPTGSMRR